MTAIGQSHVINAVRCTFLDRCVKKQLYLKIKSLKTTTYVPRPRKYAVVLSSAVRIEKTLLNQNQVIVKTGISKLKMTLFFKIND